MLTNKKPLVSVLMPAYNHQNYVQEAINSIIHQTYKNIELIVLDDGSTDDTWEILKSLKQQCDERFVNVVFETKENEGICATLNKLLDKAQGDFVYLIASDDISKPIAIEKEVDFLVNNPDYCLVVGDNEIIDSKGQKCFWTKTRENTYDKSLMQYKTFGDFLKHSRQDVDFNTDDFGSYESLVIGNYIPNGYLIRKSVLDLIPSIPQGDYLEDYYMMLQLSKYMKFKFLDEVLFSYRWHDSNTIKNVSKARIMTSNTKNLESVMLEKFKENSEKSIFPLEKIMLSSKIGRNYKNKKLLFLTKAYYRNSKGKEIRKIKLKNFVLFTYKCKR